MTKPFAKITTSALLRVVPFRATEDMRHYLNGICIEPHADGAVCVATNGHYLGTILSRESKTSARIILPMDESFHEALMRHSSGIVTLESKDSYPMLSYRDKNCYIHPEKLIDANYPEWRRVLPAEDDLAPGLPGEYNARYLKDIINAACEATTDERYPGIQFFHPKADPLRGVTVLRASPYNSRDLLMALMPMWRDGQLDKLPKWICQAESSAPAHSSAQGEKA